MISKVQRSPTTSSDLAIGQLSEVYSRGRAMAEASHLAGSVTEPYSRKGEFVHRTKKSGDVVITAGIGRAEHTMTRLDIATRMPFDEFRAAFERAAPAFDPAPVQLITEAGGSWDDVSAAGAVNV